jgi:hypothetical protein
MSNLQVSINQHTEQQTLDIWMNTLYVKLADDSSSLSSTTPAAPFVRQNESKKICAVSHGVERAALLFCDVFLMVHDSLLAHQHDWSDLHDLFSSMICDENLDVFVFWKTFCLLTSSRLMQLVKPDKAG